jgi:NADH-quinone oxidoreductase subunit C
MTNEAIKALITTIVPNAVFEEGGQWLIVQLQPDAWKPCAQWLRNGPLQLDYLFCVTGIDWWQTATGKNLMTMVYHLSSTATRDTVVVKVQLDRSQPVLATVSDIWRTAEFHEREAYDLLGVQFLEHPDLRRLVLTDDFEGYPLRKDFEDPVNMIRL